MENGRIFSIFALRKLNREWILIMIKNFFQIILILVVFLFIIVGFYKFINYRKENISEVGLRHKIGQMLMIGFEGKELNPEDPIVQAILAQQIGGVILFDKNKEKNNFDKNIESPEQVKRLTQQLQVYTKQAALNNKNDLFPLLIEIDYEGGMVERLKPRYGFPKTLSAADIGRGTDEQASKYAHQMADIVKQVGINFNFAPVLDVNVNPENPVIGVLGYWGIGA
ncbi:glycoside hydrolase family 3 N-terminal domain-containing protein [Wolbachia endosymbiont (group E) of Neria commutata]|uniref:glycoside hydrolase family 3 N-terminal domain-containing protein n=1 Tax=Wolbachia endosymbiont (group E) of Neria commutata TaxID=3066149 RepID=UPI003132EC1A